jgi:radical SAM protein with 4Fe4S-binding SPASM domain
MYTQSPQYIQFYPTLECDLACPFCFNRGIAPRSAMGINDFDRFLSLISDRGVKELDILGGEPTLHPEITSMIDRIYKHNLKATISTNGRNKLSLLKEIIQNYHGRITVGVSLNSSNVSPELHEYITTFNPIVKSVLTKERKIPDAGMTYLMRRNVDYYLLFMDTVVREDLNNSLPFYEFFRELLALKETYKTLDGVYCSGFIPDTESHPVLAHVRCPAGTTKLSVMPDGDVYPCYLFFRHKEFNLGNILRDDFEKLWNSPILAFFRNFLGNRCQKSWCPLFSSCHGGCPAVSFLICNDLGAPDPRCFP